jgi:hypothetical protein
LLADFSAAILKSASIHQLVDAVAAVRLPDPAATSIQF